MTEGDVMILPKPCADPVWMCVSVECVCVCVRVGQGLSEENVVCCHSWRSKGRTRLLRTGLLLHEVHISTSWNSGGGRGRRARQEEGGQEGYRREAKITQALGCCNNDAKLVSV